LILEALILISQQERTELLPADWKALAMCESSMNPEALNPTGKYRGLFQFDMRSWEWVGGSGDPSRASVIEQLKRAKILKERQGWSAWPACSKKLGLK
jgi:resuscitation-promoting factor RpfB